MSPITNKTEMYRLQQAGLLGNTLPQYNSLREFIEAKDESYPLWAVRFIHTLNDPRTKFNLHPRDLAEYVLDDISLTIDSPLNISPMLDHHDLRLWAQMRTDDWALWYIPEPKTTGLTWRQGFNTPGLAKHAEWSRARMLVRQYADENSYQDLQDLSEQYPNHVLEFSCYGRDKLGTLPGRNTVVWEVRRY